MQANTDTYLGAINLLLTTGLAVIGGYIGVTFDQRNDQLATEAYVREHLAGWMVLYENYQCNGDDCDLVDGLSCFYRDDESCGGRTISGGVEGLMERVKVFEDHDIPAYLVPSQYLDRGEGWMIVSPALGVEDRPEACRQAGLMLTGHGRNANRFPVLYGGAPLPAEGRPHVEAMRKVLILAEDEALLRGFTSKVPCGETQYFFWHKPNIAMDREHYERLVFRSADPEAAMVPW